MSNFKDIITNSFLLRIGAVIFLGIFVYSLLFDVNTPYPGNRAPDIQFYSLFHGTLYRLGAFRGRWIMLNFWASWCPPCRDEFPAMIRLWQHFRRDDHWSFIWVSVAEPEADSRAFVREVTQGTGVDPEELPLFIDTAGQASSKFGVWKYPETFILNPAGLIVARIIGPRQWSRGEWTERFKVLDFTAVK